MNTNVSAGNTGIFGTVNNAGTNTNNIANAVLPSAPGVQTLPLPIPVGGNAPPPAPQIFVPTPVQPGPLDYPMTGPSVNSLLNQPAATLMDGPPALAAYTPPVYSTSTPMPLSPPPTPAQQPSPAPAPPPSLPPLPPLPPPPRPVPAWRNPNYVVPCCLCALVLCAIVIWWRSRYSKPSRASSAATAAPARPQVAALPPASAPKSSRPPSGLLKFRLAS